MEMTLWLSALMVLSAGLLVLKAQPVPKTA
jgi:hypothetical protein